MHQGSPAAGLWRAKLEHPGHRHNPGIPRSACLSSNGAAFGDSDVRSATRVALIGKTVAENLFNGDDPVGKTMRIQQNPFIVVGVLWDKGQNLDGRDQDDTVIIRPTTAQRKVFGTPFLGSVRMIMVQAESADGMQRVMDSATALLRQRHRLREGQPDDFFMRNLSAAADSEAETTRTMPFNSLLGHYPPRSRCSSAVFGIIKHHARLGHSSARAKSASAWRLARARRYSSRSLVEAVMISFAGCRSASCLALGIALAINFFTGWSSSLRPGGADRLCRGGGRRHFLRLVSGAKGRAS